MEKRAKKTVELTDTSGGEVVRSVREFQEGNMEDHESKPVVINAESGSTVTVNINVNNYGYPEWFDQESFNSLLAALGRGEDS